MGTDNFVRENVYEMKTYPGFPGGMTRFLPPLNQHYVRLVTFELHGGIPFPSRILLDFHVAIARILSASGMRDYIERILEEQKMIRCLSSDKNTDVETLLFLWYELCFSNLTS